MIRVSDMLSLGSYIVIMSFIRALASLPRAARSNHISMKLSQSHDTLYCSIECGASGCIMQHLLSKADLLPLRTFRGAGQVVQYQ
jgi:hypothetical protein